MVLLHQYSFQGKITPNNCNIFENSLLKPRDTAFCGEEELTFRFMIPSKKRKSEFHRAYLWEFVQATHLCSQDIISGTPKEKPNLYFKKEKKKIPNSTEYCHM